MIAQCLQVVHTYTTRRLLILGVAVGFLFCCLFLFIASSDEQVFGQMAFACLGFPMMIGGLVLASHAKYQFVHPRSQLIPGYATPHLLVLVGLVLCLTLLYPLVVAWRINGDVVGLLAFAALFVSMVLWQIQTLSSLLSLAVLAIFFSLYSPAVLLFWTADLPELLPARLGLLMLGWTGIAAWLWRLPNMSEQDSDYLIPVQSGLGNQSRVEKSEARHLVTRMIAKHHLHGWMIDRWHDQLAQVKAPAEDKRPRLLEYGMRTLPVQVMVPQMILMIVSIVTVQYYVMSGLHGDSEHNTSLVPMLVGQCGFILLLCPMMASQMLAMRRPRLAQDLMLPMTREALVDGLFWQITQSVLWALVPTLVLVVLATWALARQYFTPLNVVAFCCAATAVQPLTIVASLHMALIQSGMKRLFCLLLAMYPLAGLAVGIFFTFLNAGPIVGTIFAAAVFALGYVSFGGARHAWLKAEFG